MSDGYFIDELDKRIINFLMSNARIPFLEIARECNISGAAVHQRVQKLEEAGVLTGSRFTINEEVLGYKTKAFVGVFFERANMYPVFKGEIEKIEEIIECHFTTGKYAVLIKVCCMDNQHLKKVLLRIHELEGVSSTETLISIEQPIFREIKIS
ncbi:MAG: transcriptional regulator [Bacteroidetes bacterium GWF2_38_335]|nr:MAG: transcriptional regulator [Bacteroidetes bacterium GWF2_38_335]OFY77508.1 MAG: transcriptional regulator [Bacteroidetes bacterium RIFOXYA12_FULL_38_20]HBS87196.1 transcriptional regulator [Bacteroidales bacterium]